jgi:hypothetical protein
MGAYLALTLGVALLAGLCQVMVSQTVRGKLPRNELMGIRTRATKSSDAAWDAGHRAAVPAERVTARFGLVLVVIAAVVAVIVRPGEDPGWEILVPAVGFVGTVVGLIVAGVAANRAAKGVADGAS